MLNNIIILFLGKCLYASKFEDKLNVSNAQEFCAFRGGLIVPIKSTGFYNFLKAHATANGMDDFHIGKCCFVNYKYSEICFMCLLL